MLLTRPIWRRPCAMATRHFGVLAVTCLIVLGVVVAAATPATAKVSRYSYGDSNCTKGKPEDPINVVWYGRQRLGDESLASYNFLNNNFGWTAHDGSPSWIVSADYANTVCDPQNNQNASAGGAFDRDHIRSWDDPNSSRSAAYAVGDAHRDIDSHCGLRPTHSAFDFNGPRDRIFDTIGASQYSTTKNFYRHMMYVQHGGGSRPKYNCDGRVGHPDGQALWIHLKAGD